MWEEARQDALVSVLADMVLTRMQDEVGTALTLKYGLTHFSWLTCDAFAVRVSVPTSEKYSVDIEGNLGELYNML